MLYCAYQFRQRILGIAVKHSRDWFEEERIFETGEAFALSAFEDNDGFRVINFENWHAGDGAARIVARIGIDNIVRADDDCDICCWKLRIDLLELV